MIQKTLSDLEIYELHESMPQTYIPTRLQRNSLLDDDRIVQVLDMYFVYIFRTALK